MLQWGLILCSVALCFAPSLADTFTVTHTGDAGPGSLRQALTDANDHAGDDLIVFNIPMTDENFDDLAGVWTLRPLSALPSVLDDSTSIDGASQALFIGSDTNPAGPEIELDGSQAGEADGLEVLSGYNTIRDLVINNFQKFGIEIPHLAAIHNTVKGCYIGTDPTGTMDLGNGLAGIQIYGGASHNVIGGTTAEERNICSGNGWSGIDVQAWGTEENLIIGNFIGTDATGTVSLGNDTEGVNIWSGAQYNTVGGAEPGAGNVISGNGWSGIGIGTSETDYNEVYGNYIGVNSLGTAPLPNGMAGVSMGGDHNIIGGTAPGEGNVISGNDGNGVELAVGTGNTIAGNFIGTDPTSTLNLGNYAAGIYLHYGAHDNIVGAGNVIMFNGYDGVTIESESTVENTITQNSITGNDDLGIENELGGNTELPPPTLTAAGPDTYTGTAPPDCTVEIFSDTEDEGTSYEGNTLSDGAGHFTWSGTPAGPNLTATATDAAGNTSEFSSPHIITAIVDGQPAGLPAGFYLAQNQPNPFNPQTVISYHLPTAAVVTISIFDAAGRLITTLVQEWQAAGPQSVTWRPDPEQAASGVYFYRIVAGDFTAMRKAMLVR
jgi:hypothetical protein